MKKAIETHYHDYRFRSRLEARWAVFFDSLGVDYQYEPEGFKLGSAGWYLPDFWLPQNEFWLEIKAKSVDEQPLSAESVAILEKARLLSDTHEALLIMGDCYKDKYEIMIFLAQGWGGRWGRWIECNRCGSIGVYFIAQPRNSPMMPLYKFPCDHQNGYSFESAALDKAFRDARSARFEHGEKGAPGSNRKR